jgi:arginyl-tRNA synthetase
MTASLKEDLCSCYIQEEAPRNPRAVGEALVAALPRPYPEPIGAISLAGPGFVNITLADAVLAKRIDTMLLDGIKTWAPQVQLTRPRMHGLLWI